MSDPISLGQATVDDTAFGLDAQVSERYQNFSGELLRLSLLAIAGVGFMAEKLDLSSATGDVKFFVSTALVLIGIGAAAALAHRYVGSDSLAFHLEYLRLRARGAAEDATRKEIAKRSRNVRFKLAGRLLLVSAVGLSVGVGCLIAAFLALIW